MSNRENPVYVPGTGDTYELPAYCGWCHNSRGVARPGHDEDECPWAPRPLVYDYDDNGNLY